MGTDDGFEGLGSPLSDVGGDHTQHINGINGEGDEVSAIGRMYSASNLENTFFYTHRTSIKAFSICIFISSQ